MGNNSSTPYPPLDPQLIFANAPVRLIINKSISSLEVAQLTGQLSSTLCKTTDLFLNSTKLTPKDFQTLLSGLLKNSSITFLDISNTTFDDQSCKHLALLLRYNNTIETIIMNDNSVTNVGLELILHSLQHNTSLSTLTILRNRITDEKLHIAAATVNQRPSLEFQRKDIDHTIAINTNGDTPKSNKTSNSPLNNNNNNTNNINLNHINSPISLISPNIIVVTATPTLSVLNPPDAPRERRRSRAGSKTNMDDLQNFQNSLRNTPNNPHNATNSTNPLNESSGHLNNTPIVASSRANQSGGSNNSQNSTKSGKKGPNNSQNDVFVGEDDTEAMSYFQHSTSTTSLGDLNNLSTPTGSNKPSSHQQQHDASSPSSNTHSSLSSSSSASISPSSRQQQPTPKVSKEQSNGGDDDLNEWEDDYDDEEWALNDDDYRRSTTFLGNSGLMNSLGESSEWDTINDNDLIHSNRQKRSKRRAMGVPEAILEGDNEEDEDDYDDDYDGGDLFDSPTVFQTGYDVHQYQGQSNEESSGLNLLDYMTMDFDYFGSVQIDSSNFKDIARKEAQRATNSNDDDVGNTSTKGDKNKEKGKKKKGKGVVDEPVPVQPSVVTKQSKKDKATATPTINKQKKNKNIATNQSESSSTTTTTRPSSATTPTHSTTPPPTQSTTPSLEQVPQDNNGTLTWLIQLFLDENNSEPGALHNFGKMCKLYRRGNITLERYGRVLFYFFNFSQLSRILPRLISSLFDHEYPNTVDEWFGNHSQAPAMFSLSNYADTLTDREMFQLSLCCCKVPNTVSPLDGEDYELYLEEMVKKELAVDGYQKQHENERALKILTQIQWKAGQSYNLYQWWVNEGCSYLGMPLMEPISDIEEERIIKETKDMYNAIRFQSRGNSPANKNGPKNSVFGNDKNNNNENNNNNNNAIAKFPPPQNFSPVDDDNRDIDVFVDDGALDTVKVTPLPTSIPQSVPIATQQSLQPPSQQRSNPKRNTLNALNISTNDVLLPTLATSYSSHATPLNNNVNNNSGFGNDGNNDNNNNSDEQIVPSLRPRSSLKTLDRSDLSRLINIHKNEFLTTLTGNNGDKAGVQSSQPPAGAVKNSPFLKNNNNITNNFVPISGVTQPSSHSINNNNNSTTGPVPTPRSNFAAQRNARTASLRTPLNLNSPPPQVSPSSSMGTNPINNNTSTQVNLNNKTSTLEPQKVNRVKSFQFQLDTLDDGTHVHSRNDLTTPSNAATPSNSGNKLDSIRARLTLSRKQSLTTQLQSSSLLPISEWLFLARQPNHLSPKSNQDLSLDKLDQILASTAAVNPAHYRKEPRLSTLLFHLHLVFPNPTTASGRYPFIDQLPPQPTYEEIKKVYRQVGLVVHPDRLLDKHPTIKSLGTDVFSHISQAFKRYSARQIAEGQTNGDSEKTKLTQAQANHQIKTVDNMD